MQAKLKYRMRIQKSAYSAAENRVNVEWKPVGPLLDFEIVDDGGQDRASLEFFSPYSMREMIWGNGYEGVVSSSRLTVRNGLARGKFSFTSRLMRGSYQMTSYTSEFLVPRFQFVKK
jgi:hypothetical protein